jgi:hypothetical protein
MVLKSPILLTQFSSVAAYRNLGLLTEWIVGLTGQSLPDLMV